MLHKELHKELDKELHNKLHKEPRRESHREQHKASPVPTPGEETVSPALPQTLKELSKDTKTRAMQTEPAVEFETPISEILDQTFAQAIDRFNSCPGMQRFWAGSLTAEHYASLMREIYFHTRENPQIQALATVHFRGAQRRMVKPFLRHAISEVGHDQLALNDMAALGWNTEDTACEQPLPATTAITAFPFYQITNLNPVGYLGYLYFLEAMPTTFGAEYMRTLEAMGVARDAMSFLHDHSTIDVGHVRLMEDYVAGLIRDRNDLDAVRYAMQVTGELYGRMVTDAFAAADQKAQGTLDYESSFGINHAEQAA